RIEDVSTLDVMSPEIDPGVYARRWWTLAVLCLSLLIVFVGNSSLNVTIPTLSRVLGATTAQLQWVIAAYSLVFAGLLFSTGALGDRYGRKGALQLGLIIYLVACVLATMSDAMWQLIACRAVMGVGAALIMPSTLSILVNVFPPEERTKAIAIWAGVTGGAGAIGQVATGLLLGHFWYGSVFFVNVPILVAALVAGWFLVPKSRDPEQGKLDPVGAVLSIVGISSLVYGLIQAPQIGWLAPETLLAFVISAVVLTVFVLWELRVDEPMLDMRYFRNPAFSTGTGGMILVFLSMFGVMFLITQYFQLILGYSPLGAAVRFLPMAPIMAVVAPLTPRLSARFGANRVVAAGMTGVALGFVMFRSLGPHTSYWYVLACIVPMVSGMALSMSPMTASIMSAVPPRRAGAGSAMNDATRELGAALGIALMGSVAASAYSSSLAGVLRGLPETVKHQARTSLADALAAGARLGGPVGQALISGAQHAFIDGIVLAVTAGAALAAIAAVLVYRTLPREAAHGTALESPIAALEATAELFAGVEPAFASEREFGESEHLAAGAGE
ncbi:MAG TPA: DHA2 family efflux MFS transporter permease subunit, partial [Acidimicrobiia bacterium]|nr:DHA2 family efflux MFS transporter permease subunit [Acidimicrobiia bacterium]